MNRLLSGEPREVIIYKIIQDGIYRQTDAQIALSDYIASAKDEAIIHYYDTMISNADALDDAYSEALLCSDPNMQEVRRLLEEYFQIADAIIDDISTCALTDETLVRLTANAGDMLEQAQEYSLKCLKTTGSAPENDGGTL